LSVAIDASYASVRQGYLNVGAASIKRTLLFMAVHTGTAVPGHAGWCTLIPQNVASTSADAAADAVHRCIKVFGSAQLLVATAKVNAANIAGMKSKRSKFLAIEDLFVPVASDRIELLL
jgi:hypothetical protein